MGQSLEGRWDATLANNGAVIPFRLDISGSGPTLKGTLYNGEDKEYTTNASFENGTLILNLEHYLTKIIATEKDGKLVGKVEGPRRESIPGEAVCSLARVDGECPVDR